MYHLLIVTILSLPFQSGGKRVIEIFTRNVNDPDYKQQLKILSADKAGMDERDLVMVKHILNKQSERLFKEKNIKENLTVILTGKDGGEKFRSTKPVSLQQLYGIIDAMPMRKQEIRSKGK